MRVSALDSFTIYSCSFSMNPLNSHGFDFIIEPSSSVVNFNSPVAGNVVGCEAVLRFLIELAGSGGDTLICVLGHQNEPWVKKQKKVHVCSAYHRLDSITSDRQTLEKFVSSKVSLWESKGYRSKINFICLQKATTTTTTTTTTIFICSWHF